MLLQQRVSLTPRQERAGAGALALPAPSSRSAAAPLRGRRSSGDDPAIPRELPAAQPLPPRARPGRREAPPRRRRSIGVAAESLQAQRMHSSLVSVRSSSDVTEKTTATATATEILGKSFSWKIAIEGRHSRESRESVRDRSDYLLVSALMSATAFGDYPRDARNYRKALAWCRGDRGGWCRGYFGD